MIYPQNPKPTTKLIESGSFNVLYTDLNDNTEQRRLRGVRSKRVFSLQYERLQPSDIAVIHGFYNQVKGSYLPFTFIRPDIGAYQSEYVAKQTGSEISFDLPCVSATALTVYVDGVETSVTLTAGAGTDGRDLIIFPSAPDLGSLITADFAGYLAVNARFNMSLTRETEPVFAGIPDIELVEVF